MYYICFKYIQFFVGETGSSCYKLHFLKRTMQTKRATLMSSMRQDDYVFIYKSVEVLKFELTF